MEGITTSRFANGDVRKPAPVGAGWVLILLYLLTHVDQFSVSVGATSSPAAIAPVKTFVVAADVADMRSAVVSEFVVVLTGHK